MNGIEALKLRGRDWSCLPSREKDALIEKCFVFWRVRGFPYESLTSKQILSEYLSLARLETQCLWNAGILSGSNVGLGLANSFHPQMWAVRSYRAHSPLARFEHDDSLRRALRRALEIWPDRCAVNESNLRAMLRTFSKTTRVSNFRPTSAKAIIERFSSDLDTVLDFSAGYSGRLLGCAPLDRKYLGIDPDSAQIKGGHDMLRALSKITKLPGKYALIQGCAEDVLPTLKKASFSLIFSSPPYFNLERYSADRSQSYVRFPTYGEWRELFLQKIIHEAARLLKMRGYLVINAANVNGYKIADDCSAFARSVLSEKTALRLRLTRKPYLKAADGDPFKYESLVIFQKR